MRKDTIGILHYSAPPVIGGVEAVMKAHSVEILRAGYSCTVISGRGEQNALPEKAKFISIPEIDSSHPEIRSANRVLESGAVPKNFEELEQKLSKKLKPITKTRKIFVFSKLRDFVLSASAFHKMQRIHLKDSKNHELRTLNL